MSESDIPVVNTDQLTLEHATVQVGSTAWYDWLDQTKKFKYEGMEGHFLARCETRRNKKVYWYAYRRQAGQLNKVYLGKSDQLTCERLRQASISLAERVAEDSLPDADISIEIPFLPTAKVNIPTLPQKLVERPRLTHQINTPLVLLNAPSGFGKSTLLNAWRQSCDFPVGWLSLDVEDNNPLRFLSALSAALQMCCPEPAHELLPYSRISSSVPLSETIIELSNGISQVTASGQKLGLILDDFHHIHYSEIYEGVQAWMEHLSANFMLILSGRIKPPLALGHLRANGMVTEIDSNDLRFTMDEGINYLSQFPQEPPLAHDDMMKLVNHTEGWAAGLTLAALALGKQDDPRRFIDTFSGAHIYLREYFMETVLQQTTPDTQDFLLKTSILKTLTGSLCDALSGRTDGDEMLSRLWSENLFIVQLEEQGWYRYHDLFAEMLYSQLQARLPEQIPSLHKRAAQWYREQYAPADVIYHLLAIKAWEEAAALMEERALFELEHYGEDSRLLYWLEELPESVVQQHKELLIVYLRLAASALPREKIKTFITRIEGNITCKPVSRRTPDEIEVLTEIRHIWQAWEQQDSFSLPAAVESRYDERWDLLNGLLRILGKPYSRALDKQTARLYEKAQAQQNLFIILMVGGIRATWALNSGHLRRSEKIAHQVLRQAIGQRGSLPGPASIALATLGKLHFEQNELTLAQKYLQRAAEVDPNPTSTNMPVLIAIRRAELQSMFGKTEEAYATLRAARELHTRRPSGIWTERDLLAHEADIHLRNGDILVAEQLLSQGGEAGVHALSDLVYAEIALMRNQFSVAERLLSKIIVEHPNGLQNDHLMDARVMLPLALFGQHKISRARRMMAETIRVAAPEKFCQPFLKRSLQCLPLLALVLHTENLTSDSQEFIDDILRTTDQYSEIQSSLPEEYTDLVTAASITSREQDILNLLGTGLTNREMALQLGISESTVKTHLVNIYTKLDVNSRVQALSQAQALKLI